MSLEMFESFLEKRCLKVTRQRRQVYKEILAMDDNFDVDSLLLRLRQKGDKISKATIYRTLQLLMECGLLRRVQLSPDGQLPRRYMPRVPKGARLTIWCVPSVAELYVSAKRMYAGCVQR